MVEWSDSYCYTVLESDGVSCVSPLFALVHPHTCWSSARPALVAQAPGTLAAAT